jgi:uncharacterized protein
MNSRASELMQALQLQAHPEGGWFREVFRSNAQVQPHDQRSARSALTSIYFLLEAGQRSQWHRVSSDEVWVYLEGDALTLSWQADGSDQQHRAVLGPVDVQGTQRPQHTIAAGLWQAAESLCRDEATRHGYTLVACLVGPGFDFADFTLQAQAV